MMMWSAACSASRQASLLLGATRKQPVPRAKAAEGGSTLVFQVAAPLQRHLQGLLDAPTTRAPPT